MSKGMYKQVTERVSKGETVLVFVYGSLLTGMGNNRHMSGCRLVGPATTQGSGLALHDTGYGFPAVERGGYLVTPIVGELYEVPAAQLPHLDRFEGVPRLYQRTTVAVVLDNGRECDAYIYTMGSEQIQPQFKPLPAGNWRAYRQGLASQYNLG